jgi:hypothetical protein
MAEYDPQIIEAFADKLYNKASAAVGGSVILGGALGAAFGSIPLTPLGDAWPIPSAFGFATLLVGAIVGALIGYVIGYARSFGYRLQAQAALCQIEIQRNTAAARTALEAITARKPAPQAQRPAAPPPPVAAPAPSGVPAPPLTPPLSAPARTA